MAEETWSFTPGPVVDWLLRLELLHVGVGCWLVGSAIWLVFVGLCLSFLVCDELFALLHQVVKLSKCRWLPCGSGGVVVGDHVVVLIISGCSSRHAASMHVGPFGDGCNVIKCSLIPYRPALDTWVWRTPEASG